MEQAEGLYPEPQTGGREGTRPGTYLKASKECMPSSKAKPPKLTQNSATSWEAIIWISELPQVHYSLCLWGNSSEEASHPSFNRVLVQEVLNLISAGGPLEGWQLPPVPGADTVAVACAVNPTPPPAGILDLLPSHKVQGELFTLLQVITSSSLK